VDRLPPGLRAFLTTLADMGLGTLLLLPGTRTGVIGLLLASLALASLVLAALNLVVVRDGPAVRP
jgi:hypothetical protein